MRILAVDVGTGTQDILLFDSSRAPENCFKLVAPSPTQIVASRVRRATAEGRDLLLTGVTMGGGPCHWALREHLQAGRKVYATPDAARTFNDDLAAVVAMGITLVDAAPATDGLVRLDLKDFDLAAVEQALAAFDVPLELDGVAIAVQDHGAAPPAVSDRVFRFDHLRRTIERSPYPHGFAYLGADVPAHLTRMRAVASTAGGPWPVLLMDTGPAAVLGALEDPRVRAEDECIVVNVGNMHTLAFHLVEGRIVGLFEHHTGMLKQESLESFIVALAAGSLTHAQVFDDGGHGALVVERVRMQGLPLVAVTGPRRGLLSRSRLSPHFTVPHGDMMVAGCFGLVRAFGAVVGAWRDPIATALGH